MAIQIEGEKNLPISSASSSIPAKAIAFGGDAGFFLVLTGAFATFMPMPTPFAEGKREYSLPVPELLRRA